MPATYEPIATQTLASAAATITFSSIPATFTDLRFTLAVNGTSSVGNPRFTFNSDTGANYSRTILSADGASAVSTIAANTANLSVFSNASTSTTIPTFYTVDVFSYAGSTNKTVLAQGSADLNGSGGVSSAVGLWRNTAAITTITWAMSTGNFSIGTTATLYGIKAA